MPNRKIFLILLFFMAVLYMGLEWLPTLFVQPSPDLPPALSSENQTHRAWIGTGVIGYFLLLSALIYAKIRLQSKK
jgi:hypothetical protein